MWQFCLSGTVIGGSNFGRVSPSMMLEISNVSSTCASRTGRPLGSTEALNEVKRQKLINAKNEIEEKRSHYVKHINFNIIL